MSRTWALQVNNLSTHDIRVWMLTEVNKFTDALNIFNTRKAPVLGASCDKGVVALSDNGVKLDRVCQIDIVSSASMTN